MKSKKTGHYGPCSKCQSRMKINGICTICGDGKKTTKKDTTPDIVDKVKKTRAKAKTDSEK